MKRIAVITGTRAEYGILRPVIDKIDFDPAMKLQLVVTGSHLSPEHGMTVHDIENDGFPVTSRVDMLLSGDAAPVMGKSLGIGITGLTTELERLAPEIVIVLGDRIEAFAGAIAGLFCGALVVHIHGGELTKGGMDEYMRHAITKLAHVHFTATEKAKTRVINMGEHPGFVYCSGSPGLDDLLEFPVLSAEEMEEKLGFSVAERYALIVQHPVSTHAGSAADEMSQVLEAVKQCNISTVLAYPNADAGRNAMMDVIRRYESEEWLNTYINLPRKYYCNLLRNAAVMVGNSSSGLIDAGSFGVPVVNIGQRQEGRERGANVIDAPMVDAELIQKTIQQALSDEFKLTAKNAINPYGDGDASGKIHCMLQTIDADRARNSKRLPW